MTEEQFNNTFISVKGIANQVGVVPAAVYYAVKRGTLPEPIRINDLGAQLWVREEIKTVLENWKKFRSETRHF